MKGNYALGLVSVSFRKHTPQQILAAMCEVGLSHIEWGSDVHAPCRDLAALREFAVLQAQYGITCSSYGTYFRLGETPLPELEEYIAAARILGTDILRLWCGTKSCADMSKQEKAALLDICLAAAEIAARNGVTFCMECHRGTLTEHAADAVWLMEAVDSPHFKMYWQPFQWQTPIQNMENAKKIAPYATHLHVFNWKGSLKLPLAQAIDEWRAYLAAFSVPRTLLLEFMPFDSLDELAVEAEALKKIIGEEA